MQARHSYWWHLIIDLPILLLVAAFCILVELGAVPTRRSGFLCNDPALSYPHTGDTFSIAIVGLITVVAPFLLIWAVEATLHREEEYSLKQHKLCTSARAAALIYRDYIFVAVVNLTFAEVLKCVVGSPRPSFFDLCEPDTAKTCNGSEFVGSYTCTSARHSAYLRMDASRSFPSAHAALSVYTGVFLAWYLQRRAFSWSHRCVLLAPALQLLSLSYAAVCALTRVTDHRHHWWDVLAGAAIGLVCAVYTAMVLLKNFSQQSVASSSDLSSSDGTNHPSVRRLLASARGPMPHHAV